MYVHAKFEVQSSKMAELWPFENIGFIHLLFFSYLVSTESSSKSEDADLANKIYKSLSYSAPLT